MGICIISRFAFAGRFTGGGVPVTLSTLHYPPMKRCSAVALFESSPCQHKKQTPCRDTARGPLFMELMGVEPMSEKKLVRVSPGAVCLLDFPWCGRAYTHYTLVAS